MRHIQVSVLVCVVAFATGCPTYRPKVNFKDPQGMVNKFNIALKAQYHAYECYRFGPEHIDSAGRNCKGSVQDLNKAKDIRNELLENALPYIDEAYIDFKNDIIAGRDRSNFVADVVELGASAAIGTINGPERTIQIVGIFLTAFKGGRRSADVNFYKDQSTPVLISKMNGLRARVRSEILTRERDDVNAFPMGAAIQSIVDYYNAGTLTEAFVALQQDTAVQTRRDEDEKKGIELHGVPISTPSTPELTANANQVLSLLGNLSTELAADEVGRAAAVKKLQNIIAALERDKDVNPILKVIDLKSTEPDGNVLMQGLKILKRRLPNDSPLQDKINLAIINNGN